jgi:transaldolase
MSNTEIQYPKSPFLNRIKLFLDGADRDSMIQFYREKKVSGFTTNPSLMRKAGVTEYEKYCRDLLKEIPDSPISFEVFADDLAEMKRQALLIKTWGNNVYVKIPVCNTKGQLTTELVRELSHQGVKLNVTALFTIKEIVAVCDALQGGAPSIVSVFAGRIADSGRDPMALMGASAEACAVAGSQVELLWASTREAFNVVQAEQSGCKIITAPADVIKKVSGFNRDPWELTLDTIRTFKKDSDAAGFSL